MAKYNIALLPGDGIGPEVVDATLMVMDALEKKADIEFEYKTYMIGDAEKERSGTALPQETIDGVKAADACLFACVGETAKETILPLRQMFNLYANVRPCRSFPNVEALKPNIDLVVVRENTEGMYSGVEYEVSPGVAVAMRIITREASTLVAEYAFKLAEKRRKHLTYVHKANILRITDGVFNGAVKAAAETAQVARPIPQMNRKCVVQLVFGDGVAAV